MNDHMLVRLASMILGAVSHRPNDLHGKNPQNPSLFDLARSVVAGAAFIPKASHVHSVFLPKF